MIINFPSWVVQYKEKHGEYPEEYQQIFEQENARSMFLMCEMREAALEHPEYRNCVEVVDSTLDSDNYESADIIGISETRENFDNLYMTAAEYEFNGGLVETKIGSNYVMYGFNRD